MSKIKKINPGEEFQLHDRIYQYSVVDGSIRLKQVRFAAVKPPKKQFVPPTLDEVKAYFKANGYNDIGAEKAFKYYDAGDWKDRDGNQVISWKQKMLFDH